MEMDLLERPFVEQLKRVAAYRGYTLKKLGEEFNRREGTDYNQQSFSRKVNNQRAITLVELRQFAEILGFKVKLKLLESE